MILLNEEAKALIEDGWQMTVTPYRPWLWPSIAMGKPGCVTVEFSRCNLNYAASSSSLTEALERALKIVKQEEDRRKYGGDPE